MEDRTLLYAATFMLAGIEMAGAQNLPSPSAQICLSCHSGDAKAGGFPDITPYDARMIEEAMAQYRNDTRPGTIMNRIAKGFSDEETRIIAQELMAASHKGSKR